MLIWIIGAVVTATLVWAFWPRAGGLDARVRRSSAIAQSSVGLRGGAGPSDPSGGGMPGGF